jgi:hypothetical protein
MAGRHILTFLKSVLVDVYYSARSVPEDLGLLKKVD